MNIGASADHSTPHVKEITTTDNKNSLNVDALDGETSWNNSENHNESGWNYAVFDLDAEEKSKPPAWEFDENSSIKEIFNSHKDAHFPRTQTCKNSLANRNGINITNKIKTEQDSCSTCEKPRIVQGIIYLSDSDDEGATKSVSDAKTSKDKFEFDNKMCRKKRYWNASPKYKGVDKHDNAIPAQVCSDAEIEILPGSGESSKKTFKKPFHDKYRYGHLKHHKNSEFLCGTQGKKPGNYMSDSESDSLNSASVHAVGRLQKSPRCQIYPQHSQVFSRSRDAAFKNAHKSSSSLTDQEIDQRPNLEMQLLHGGIHCERGKTKNHSKKIPRPKVHFPPSEISVLNASVLPDDKQESTSSNSKNVTSNIPHRSSDHVNHSSPQLHLPPHHHHHRHHRSYNRRGTHQEISRNRDSIRNRLHLDPIIFDSDITSNDNTHNITSSPDPVRQLQQLESDEMLARMLQAQFDAEVDTPEFQRSPRRSHQRSHPIPILTGRRPTGRALRTHSTAFNSPSTPAGFLDVNAASYPLVFHNWDPSSSDDSDLDLLFPSMFLNSPLHVAEFLYGDLDWRDVSYPLMRNERSRPPTRGRSTRSWTRRNRALPNFLAGYEGNDYEALWELAEQIGEVTKRGLSWREINRLPTRIHSNPPEGFPASQCHICMCDYEEGDRLRILPCFHEFHAPCIDRWIKDNATCPVCRAKVNTERA